MEFREESGEVDIDDLSRHLDDLAGHQMNNWEIHNATTMARQLALSKKQIL
jgi:hypothetical protein